jgi:hypothetical protein
MAETSKKRARNIPLDYYKRTDRITTWRLILSAIACGLAAAWAMGFSWNFWSPSARADRARQLASHGPLTQSHAAWENQCEACHVSFASIGLATWAAPVVGDSARSNARCQECHAAPIHHASQKPQDLACASCHHDHQGTGASLVDISDQHCTQCHNSLSAHMNVDRAPVVAESVLGFDASQAHHPAFRSSSNPDPGRLTFNHARHLRPGMADEKGGPIQVLGMIAAPDKARYQRYAQGPKGVIQLDCAACHQLERSETRDISLPPPPTGRSLSSGAYMMPINSETHCRACHPLDYDPSDPAAVMQHALQPAAVHARLWDRYAAEYLKEVPGLLDQRIAPAPLPGKPESPHLIEARQAIDRKVSNAEKILFGAKKCGECHQYETSDGKPVPALDHFNPKEDVRIVPPKVPVIWWRSARFDHSAHRGLSCRACHERAYPDSQHASTQSKDVLLPGKAECLECHSPRRQEPGKSAMSGGADFRCTECHRYHDGDAVVLGLSSQAGRVEGHATIEQFLLGNPPRSESEEGRTHDRPAARVP